MALSRLNFLFDSHGFGDLLLLAGDGVSVLDRYVARTGSIDIMGKLINPMPIDIYRIQEHTEPTSEDGMWILDKAQGWKARLFVLSAGKWEGTHLLVHPDGGRPGTLGCIGLQGTNGLSLRHEIDALIDAQKYIPMTVGHK
jgi:hypothetical protein